MKPLIAGLFAIAYLTAAARSQHQRDVEIEQRRAFMHRFATYSVDSAGMTTLLYATRAERVNSPRGKLPKSHPAYLSPDSGLDEEDIVLARTVIPGGGAHH